VRETLHTYALPPKMKEREVIDSLPEGHLARSAAQVELERERYEAFDSLLQRERLPKGCDPSIAATNGFTRTESGAAEPRQLAPPSPGHTFLRGLHHCPVLRLYLDRDRAAAIAIAGTAAYREAALRRPDLGKDREALKKNRKFLRPPEFQERRRYGTLGGGGFHRAPLKTGPRKPRRPCSSLQALLVAAGLR
jgi:hypothetical protein